MRRSIAYRAAPAIRDALASAETATSSQAADLGRAARALFDAALAAEPHDRRLIRIAIEAVARTFATDAAESELRLRQLIDHERIAKYGHEEMPALSADLASLFAVVPEFCADVYDAVFTNVDTANDTTVMATGVMSLTSTRRQDYGLALYELAEIYPRFLHDAADAAARALVAARAAYSRGRTVGNHDDAAPMRVSRDGSADAVFLPDASGLWSDEVYRHEDAVRMLDAFEQHLVDVANATPDRAVEIAAAVLRLEAPAAIWSRLFAVGAQFPDVFLAELHPLAASPVVLGSRDLSEAAIAFCAATYDRLDHGQRETIESAIFSIPDSDDPQRREFQDRRRDRLLCHLPEDLLATATARERYAALREGRHTSEEPQDPFEDGWRESTYDETQALAHEGVDVATGAFRRLKAASDPVAAFATTHLNDVPSVEDAQTIAPTLSALLRLADELDAHPLQLNSAWGSLATAARALSRQPGLDCDDPARAIAQTILLRASEHPDPQADEKSAAEFDASVSWGAPAPRVDAADGLIRLASRPECHHDAELQAIERLALDRAHVVRYHIAQAICILGNSEPEVMWSTIDGLRSDESNAVRGALIESLRRLLGRDEQRVMQTVRDINAAIDDAAPGGSALRKACLSVVANVYFVKDDDDAGQTLRDAIGRLPATTDEVGGIVFELRDVWMAGPVDVPDASQDGLRRRAIDFIERALTGAVAAARSAGEDQPPRQDQWAPEAAAAWKRSMQLADRIAAELYFRSGVYRASQGHVRAPDPTAAQRRLFSEAAGIFDALVDVGAPSIAQHLLQTLEFFIDVNPRDVFMRIVATIRAGQAWGYQYDPQAEAVFVRVVERYIAEHRTMLQQDQECSRALVEILDIFVRAGWKSARRLTHGLSDIYR